MNVRSSPLRAVMRTIFRIHYRTAVLTFAWIVLVFVLVFAGCSRGPTFPWQHFQVGFRFQEGTREIALTDQQIQNARLRSSVARSSREVLDTLPTKTRLRAGRGYMDIVAGGAPPYLAKVVRVEITEPRIAEMHAAAELGDMQRVRALLATGHAIDERDPDNGRTALIHAVVAKKKRAVEELLSLGADPTIADNEGATPRRCAEDLNLLDIAEVLANAGRTKISP